MISKGIIKSLLISTTLAWSSVSYSQYADIGYNDGLAMEASLRVTGDLYFRAGMSEDIAHYGLGYGYRSGPLNTVISIDNNDGNISSSLHMTYRDIASLSYFATLGYVDGAMFNYRIGAGWSINERASLITHYSNDGVFFGLRRWF